MKNLDYLILIVTYFLALIDGITTYIALNLNGIKILKPDSIYTVNFTEERLVSRIMIDILGIEASLVIMPLIAVSIVALYILVGDKIITVTRLGNRYRKIYRILLLISLLVSYYIVISNNIANIISIK